MPIGVPRIIYCWGEELPAQWTDIYNFIFRRRMVFLMQYLDDELCNQICGLLINIHMEDRSKELEKKEMQSSYAFKSGKSGTNKAENSGIKASQNLAQAPRAKKVGGPEDLLTAEDDLAIDQNNMLEQYTLQKITMEWLNWNAQFFDYSDPNSYLPEAGAYLYYLADILSKDFGKDSGNAMYSTTKEQAKTPLQNKLYSSTLKVNKKFLKLFQNSNRNTSKEMPKATNSLNSNQPESRQSSNGLELYYGPFRSLANFAASTTKLPLATPEKAAAFNNKQTNLSSKLPVNKGLNKLLTLTSDYAKQKLLSKGTARLNKDTSKLVLGTDTLKAENALGQRLLKREYLQDQVNSNFKVNKSRTLVNYAGMPFSKAGSPDLSGLNSPFSLEDFNQYARKVSTKAQGSGSMGATMNQEEESKKVFVIINSFGGSVGNGITVHDALQFIKAGSLTLGLGVAASAASLVLAGGTIGERYVTEGCHVMIHQPEGGLNGQASDIWIDANEIMKIRLDVAEIYSLSTYRPRHKILRDLDRDFYLTATETIQYGLADEIATNEVMSQIVEMTSKAWYEVDAQQQRLLENVVQRVDRNSGVDAGSQASS